MTSSNQRDEATTDRVVMIPTIGPSFLGQIWPEIAMDTHLAQETSSKEERADDPLQVSPRHPIMQDITIPDTPRRIRLLEEAIPGMHYHEG